MARRKYTGEEIDLALTAFAQEGGRQQGVEALLLAAELPESITYSLVWSWAYRTYHERYERIATEVEKLVRARLADNNHRLAQMSAELSEDILRRINDELERRDQELIVVSQQLADTEARLGVLVHDDTEEAEDEKKRLLADRRELWKAQTALRANLKELAKLLHESGVMGGIATEKHAMLTGRPTKIVEHDFTEVRAALERKGVRLVVGGGQLPATPPPDSDPVPPDRRLGPGDSSRDAGDS